MAARSVPVQRTLDWLRKDEWWADVGEKWIPLPGVMRCASCGQLKPRPGFPPGIRRDLFGFADVVAYKTGEGVLFVQAARDADVAAHVDKVLGEDLLKKIKGALLAGVRFEIWGWGQKGPRGQRKLWTRRRIAFKLRAEDRGGEIIHTGVRYEEEEP